VAYTDAIAVAFRYDPIAKFATARIARTGHCQVPVPVRPSRLDDSLRNHAASHLPG
jgi:hypothetical protein